MPRSKTSLFITPFMVFSAAILLSVAAVENPAAKKDTPSAARIHELISQLGSDEFAARESATQSLLEAGPAAFQAVKSAQSNEDPEIRNRAKLVHAQIVETAVKHLQQLGATFTGGKRHSPNYLSARKCKLSDKDLAHVGCLDSLTGVSLYQNPFTDEGMKHLQNLKRLEVLSLRGCRHITDEGMKHLQGMTQLRELTLDGRDISDKTLAVVSTCPKLERLAIFSEAISDDGLTHLAALNRLNWILFHGCKVSGVGLAKLKPLSAELRSLRFYNVALNDADLKALSHFPELEFVDINDAPITDAGVETLKKIPNLNILALRGTRISDRAITHLQEIRGLRRLSLGNTSVTPAGVAKLKGMGELGRLTVPDNFTDLEVLELARQLRPGERNPSIKITRE